MSNSQNLLQEELDIERWAVRVALERYRAFAQAAVDRGDAAILKSGRHLIGTWFKQYQQGIDKEKVACKRTPRRSKKCRKYIAELDSETLAAIGLHRILGECVKDLTGVPMTALSAGIGDEVITEAQFLRLRKRGCDPLERLEGLRVKHGGQLQAWMVERVFERHFPDERRDTAAAVSLGGLLVHILAKNVSPAFRIKKVPKENEDGKRNVTRCVFLTDEAKGYVEHLEDLAEDQARPRYQPMVVPPLPCSEDGGGGS